MFASLASTPTRQQGAGENWKPSAQPVQKAENSCVFTTTETQRSKGFFFFFFFPSATHTAPAISITAMWSQREQYICQQDQVLNRPRKPLNPSRHPLHWPQQSPKTPQLGHHSPIHSGYPTTFCKEDTSFTCPNCPNYLGSRVLHIQRPFSIAALQNLTCKSVFELDTETFVLENFRVNILLHQAKKLWRFIRDCPGLIFL